MTFKERLIHLIAKLKSIFIHCLYKFNIMAVYSLLEFKTGELHIFEGVMTSDTTCTCTKYSICNAMEYKDKIKEIFACKSEDEMVEYCAKKQTRKSICGNCIKHFYKTQ